MKDNLSKLQSEAVLEFKSKYPKYKYLCRYSDDFKKGEWINIEDVFKFYNDQIQKAYSEGREEEQKRIVDKVQEAMSGWENEDIYTVLISINPIYGGKK